MDIKQIIFLVIIALVSSFFKKGKGKSETPAKAQPKPFTATGRVPDNPQSKLKEMSKDLYRELQKEMQRTDEEPPSRQLQPQATPPPVVAAQSVEAPVVAVPAGPVRSVAPRAVSERKERPDSSRHSGRLSAHGAQLQPIFSRETHDLMPKSSQDLVKGIIFSEIFGPPKSKR
ncbi:hypothetical protein [Sporosarcina beigongshangi]|uniref:hypothetical protein n=1 Tax=Sporosarcina beigongshangi TaxID=2782538 RepID=UPI00193A902E|nr:hypothetical protein [Sporosarcina beigongshangi]